MTETLPPLTSLFDACDMASEEFELLHTERIIVLVLMKILANHAKILGNYQSTNEHDLRIKRIMRTEKKSIYVHNIYTLLEDMVTCDLIPNDLYMYILNATYLKEIDIDISALVLKKLEEKKYDADYTKKLFRLSHFVLLPKPLMARILWETGLRPPKDLLDSVPREYLIPTTPRQRGRKVGAPGKTLIYDTVIQLRNDPNIDFDTMDRLARARLVYETSEGAISSKIETIADEVDDIISNIKTRHRLSQRIDNKKK